MKQKRYTLIERLAGSSTDWKISEADSLDWIVAKTIRDIKNSLYSEDQFTFFVIDNRNKCILFHAGIGEVQPRPSI